MRSNSYARYTNPGKFMTPKTWAEDAIKDGDRLRAMLDGKRILILEPFKPTGIDWSKVPGGGADDEGRP